MKHILVHGLGQTAASWNQVKTLLTVQENVDCIELAPLLGEDATYQTLYRNFSKQCNQSKEPLNLCGLSLGAVLALNYAIDYPQNVNTLILVAGQYKMPKGLLKFQNIIFRFIPNKQFESMGMQKRDFIKLTNSMTDLNFTQQLQNITCPVLVVCGEKDTPNKKASQNLSTLLQHAQLKFVQKARHEVNTEAPDLLSEIINDYYATTL